MASERDRKIRDRAHQIWEESGRPEGKAEEHWAQALAEIDGQSSGGAGREGAKSAKASGSGAKPKSKAAASSGSGAETAKKPAAAKAAPAKVRKEAAPESPGKSGAGAASSGPRTAAKKKA